MLAMLAMIVDTAHTGLSEWLLLIAAVLFLIAFVFLVFRRDLKRAAPEAPTFIAAGFVLLAVALLVAAV